MSDKPTTFILLSRARDGHLSVLTHHPTDANPDTRLVELSSEEEAEQFIGALDRTGDDGQPFESFQIVKVEI